MRSLKSHLVIIMILSGAMCIGQDFKFMTYNIRYDTERDGENQWSKRKDFLSDQIAFFEPDVFGIQEGLGHQVAYLDSVLSNYTYIGVGRDDGKEKGEFSAVFYKPHRLKLIEENTFWLSESPNEVSVGWDASMERICTYALFKEKKSKQYFWVFNTHFDHIGKEARVNSARLILSKIRELNEKDHPIILMGDFNLMPDSDPIKYLSKTLSDSRIVSGLAFGPEGTFNGFKMDRPLTDRIDYIFVSKKNIKVDKYAVLTDSRDQKFPSDHLPVFIEIRLID